MLTYRKERLWNHCLTISGNCCYFCAEDEKKDGANREVQLDLGMTRRSFVAGCQVATLQVHGKLEKQCVVKIFKMVPSCPYIID